MASPVAAVMEAAGFEAAWNLDNSILRRSSPVHHILSSSAHLSQSDATECYVRGFTSPENEGVSATALLSVDIETGLQLAAALFLRGSPPKSSSIPPFVGHLPLSSPLPMPRDASSWPSPCSSPLLSPLSSPVPAPLGVPRWLSPDSSFPALHSSSLPAFLEMPSDVASMPTSSPSNHSLEGLLPPGLRRVPPHWLDEAAATRNDRLDAYAWAAATSPRGEVHDDSRALVDFRSPWRPPLSPRIASNDATALLGMRGSCVAPTCSCSRQLYLPSPPTSARRLLVEPALLPL